MSCGVAPSAGRVCQWWRRRLTFIYTLSLTPARRSRCFCCCDTQDMTTLTMQPLHHFSVGPLATGCTRVTLPSGADYVAVTTQDAVLRLYSFDDPAAQGQPLELVSPGGYRGPLLVAAASTGSGSGSLRIAVAGEPQDVSTFDASPVATRQAAGKAPAAATAASASVGRPRRGRGAAAAGGGSDPLGLAEMRTASLAGMLEAAAAADQLAGDLGRLDPSLAAAAAAAGMAAPSMPSQHHAPPGGGMPGAPGGGSLSRAPVFIWSL